MTGKTLVMMEKMRSKRKWFVCGQYVECKKRRKRAITEIARIERS